MKHMNTAHEYVRITSQQDLFSAYKLAEQKDKVLRFLAGGTDLMIELRSPGQGLKLAKLQAQIAPSLIADVSGYEEMRIIVDEQKVLSIGALCTFAQLADALPSWACVLTQAVQSVGSPQIRHRATIGGNIANGAPAADTPPALVLLNADVELWSLQDGDIVSARMPVAEYLKKRNQQENSLLSRVIIPKPAPLVRAFYKQGKRNALAISTVSLAVEALAIPWENGALVQELRLVAGAVTPSAFEYVTSVPQTLHDNASCMNYAVHLAEQVVMAMDQEYGPRASRAHKQDVIAGMLYKFLTEKIRTHKNEYYSGK